MRLASASRLGDTVTATDAYGTASFKCQLAPLELFKVEGTKIKVRQLSTSPTTVTPPRGAIRIGDQVFLIGHGTIDFWKGEPIRVNYVIQGADGLAGMHSIDGALSGTPPVSAYVSVNFNRYLPGGVDSNRYSPQYEIFLGGGEAAHVDSLIYVGGSWYLIKDSYVAGSGLRVALANILDEPVFETASFVTTTYDPVSDVRSTGSVGVKIMRVKWAEHYTYLSIGSETYERGDQQVFLPKTLTPKPSDAVTLSDGSWRILAVLDEGDRWSCHVRRA